MTGWAMRKSSWQTPRLHASLGPEAEPPSAPADLPIPLVNKQQEQETPEAPSALEKALQIEVCF